MRLNAVRFCRLVVLVACGPLSAVCDDAPLDSFPLRAPEVVFPDEPEAISSGSVQDLELETWSPPFEDPDPDDFLDLPLTSDVPIPQGIHVLLPEWMIALRDDNTLIHRQTRSETAFISHRGGFGMTSLGFILGEVQIGGGDAFLIRPKFGWHFLHGPLAPDLPSQLYDLAVEINFSRQFNDTFSLQFQVTPTLATDFDNKDADAFRLVSGGLVAVQLSPFWRLVGGLTYLDRPDLPVVPIAGLRLSSSQIALDLLIPRPRLAYRYHVGEDGEESWVYVQGELGGGSWAFERENTGRHDTVGYRDYRLLIGHETTLREGIRSVIEAGYVFDRSLEFDNGPGDFSPGDSWTIRLGVVY